MNYKDALRPWLQLSTWQGTKDMETLLFNQALHSIFEESEYQFDYDKFQEAMYELIKELHPDFNESGLEDIIQEYAIRAEYILSYLRDTK